MTPDGKKRQVGLEQAVKMWPTPKGSPEHYGQPREDDWGDLQAAVFRTPTARDWRGACRPENIQRRMEAGHSLNLTDQIGGQLNPVWVEWLMGYPLGWTDLED